MYWIYMGKYYKNRCHISALDIIKTDNLNEIGNYLIKSIGENLIIEYDCEHNGYNYNILEALGFRKGRGFWNYI
ncbi:hypothetical protein JTS97_15600 [Clostridium botulinum]|nr:hypothetical protein [Clostridium botulinum]